VLASFDPRQTPVTQDIQSYKRVYTGHNIIKYGTETTRQFLKPLGREWLNDIEKAQQNKSDDK
jgi:hypothetical protein